MICVVRAGTQIFIKAVACLVLSLNLEDVAHLLDLFIRFLGHSPVLLESLAQFFLQNLVGFLHYFIIYDVALSLLPLFLDLLLTVLLRNACTTLLHLPLLLN